MQTQACFDDIQLHILREIRKARHNIQIAVAWFTDSEIFEHLCEKARSGVRVELIIFNDIINRKSGIDYKRLATLGGAFLMVGDRKKNSGIMHNKFCIIDAATVITGSYNWSRQAQENWENITIISEHPDLAQQFITEFDSIFERNARAALGGPDHGKIIARLEALRKVIELDDDDDIILQVTKLKKLLPEGDEYAEVREIALLVDHGKYEQATPLLENYVRARKQVAVYEDPEIPELTLELKVLEIQISALEVERAELEKLLHSFHYRHAIEVGELVRRILILRREKLKDEAEKDTRKKQEFEEAQEDFEEFERDFQETRKQQVFSISEAEKQELKAIFRACSKMCHPDVVASEHKEYATRLFAQLNEANEKNDLKTIMEIYESLQKGIVTLMSDTISDAQKLHRQVVRFRSKIKDITIAITALRNSDTYQKVASIMNWDDYFVQHKQQLQRELNALEES